MRKFQRFICFAIALVCSAFVIRAPVRAQDMPTIPDGAMGTLSIRYFDDSDESEPVAGAKFKIYQVASIGRELNDNGAYLPLVDGISFIGESDAKKYQAKVHKAYGENPKLGFTAETQIGKNGIGKIDNLPAGAYFVEETETVRYHILSRPFLVSVPETNETQDGWNFDVKADPKPNIAGDLSVKKVLEGNEADKNDVFTFEIHMAEGEYKAKLPDGSEKTVKDGEQVQIKGGQTFTIYDLPEGSDYSVAEIEANQNGYTTTYKNEKGTISGKSEVETTVTNKRHKDKHSIGTGIKNNKLILMEFVGGLLAFIVIAGLQKRKNNKEEKS